MKKTTLLTTVLALVLIAPAAVLARDDKDAAASGPWIHVEVREANADQAIVNVNVPFALADAALESFNDQIGTHIQFGRHGHREHVESGEHAEGVSPGDSLGHPELSVADLRRMWKAMRDAGEAEFVTVKEGDESVRIRREGDLVRVDVDGKKDGEKVRIRVPVTVLDALLSGEGDELNVRAAVNELKTMKNGEVVRVEDGGDLVRVWIDQDSGSGCS